MLKNFLILMIGFLLGMAFTEIPFSEKDSQDKTTETTSDAELEVVSVDVNTLQQDFDENSLRAQDKYLGKRLRVSGFLRNIMPKSNSSTYVVVGTDIISVVVCNYPEEDIESLKAYSTNDGVILEGNYTESSLSGYVLLQECSMEKQASS